jgi:hypothetical protein
MVRSQMLSLNDFLYLSVNQSLTPPSSVLFFYSIEQHALPTSNVLSLAGRSYS